MMATAIGVGSNTGPVFKFTFHIATSDLFLFDGGGEGEGDGGLPRCAVDEERNKEKERKK